MVFDLIAKYCITIKYKNKKLIAFFFIYVPLTSLKLSIHLYFKGCTEGVILNLL